MNALIAHNDKIARMVFTHYCNQINIKDYNEIAKRNEVYKELQKEYFDVLIIKINWIFNVSLLNPWLRYNKESRMTKIIAVTTDFSLDHKEWCENEDISYVTLPLTYRMFKVLFESDLEFQPNTSQGE